MQKELCNPNNIVVIENFMEPDHVKEIHTLCIRSLEDPDFPEWWYNKHPGIDYAKYAKGAYKKRCDESAGIDYHVNRHPLLQFYMDKVSERITYETGRKVVPMFTFNRHQTLCSGLCPGHTDSEGMGPNGIDFMPEYSPNHLYEPAIIEFSANIYINNDYEGGQLCFPEYGIEIQHTPGQLVWFPGNLHFVHSVNKITSGTRWNLLTHLARPKLIEMHSYIYNLWHVLTDEQKAMFPETWNAGESPRGITENNLEYLYPDLKKS